MIDFFLNKKTLAIDLHKFESGEFNKILIFGVGGAGKSVAGKLFAKKYNVPLRSTDEFIRTKGVTELLEQDYKKYKEEQAKFLENMIFSEDREVIEGSAMHKPWLESQLMNFPAIIIGTSGFKGALQAGLRGVNKGEGVRFFKTLKTNWRSRTARLRNFRRRSCAMLHSVVEEIKIPNISKKDLY